MGLARPYLRTPGARLIARLGIHGCLRAGSLMRRRACTSTGRGITTRGRAASCRGTHKGTKAGLICTSMSRMNPAGCLIPADYAIATALRELLLRVARSAHPESLPCVVALHAAQIGITSPPPVG